MELMTHQEVWSVLFLRSVDLLVFLREVLEAAHIRFFKESIKKNNAIKKKKIEINFLVYYWYNQTELVL